MTYFFPSTNKMRLDHIAYRAKDRYKTANFFKDALGYEIGTEFQIKFDDGGTADCLALVPPERRPEHPDLWSLSTALGFNELEATVEFHSPRGGVGGIHHIAYQCDSVESTMKEWREKGYAEFLSEEPMECPGLKQVFTKPSELTGVIYELISREGKGFCEVNVKGLMESTKEK